MISDSLKKIHKTRQICDNQNIRNAHRIQRPILSHTSVKARLFFDL